MKCEYKLVFNANQYCPYVTSELYSKKTMCYWYKFFEKVISDFKDEGNIFNHIAERNIITIANTLDRSYDFYIKQNMCALEQRLYAMINKNKNLNNKLDRSKRHPLIGKYSHIPFNN